MTIYSVGHSTHDPEYLGDYLRERGMTHVVDVRSKPYSRFNFGFNKERFFKTLADRGIEYQWRGEQLGGMGARDETMAVSMDRMISYFAKRKGSVPVLMCSEGEPCECHRHHWLGRYLSVNSNERMVHIDPRPEHPDIPAEQLGFDPSFNADDGTAWPFERPFRVSGPGAPPWVTLRGYESKPEAIDYIKRTCPKLLDQLTISSVR